MNTLDKSRKRINQIDEELTKLFEERMHIVEDVLSYKKENNLPIFDQNREKAVLAQTKSYLQEQNFLNYQQQFMQTIMDLSKDYQHTLLSQDLVAYQGVEGAFSHIVTRKLFPNFQYIAKENFEALFQAVIKQEVQYAVIPFENSYTGEVGEVLDLLYQYEVSICAICDLKVEQNLIALPKTKLEDIKQIYSHTQAIQQSLPFLKTLEAELIPFENTALAAKYVYETNDASKAAIASKETADIYQLEILMPNIHASTDNTTRFIVIKKEANISGNRLSIQFATKHEAGELSKVIQVISEFGFNLESIKSRSSKKAAWQYYFYLEIQADIHSDLVKKMLERIQGITLNMKVTGVFDR